MQNSKQGFQITTTEYPAKLLTSELINAGTFTNKILQFGETSFGEHVYTY